MPSKESKNRKVDQALTPAPGRSSPGHSTAPASPAVKYTHTAPHLGATIEWTADNERARVTLEDGTKKTFESANDGPDGTRQSGLLRAQQYAKADHKKRFAEAEQKRRAAVEKAAKRAAKAGE